jgi:hypothetical protein
MQQQDNRDNVFRHALSGGLAEERGFDYLSEVKRGIGHWYAEHYVSDRDYLGPDTVVEMRAKPSLLSYRSFFSPLWSVSSYCCGDASVRVASRRNPDPS